MAHGQPQPYLPVAGMAKKGRPSSGRKAEALNAEAQRRYRVQQKKRGLCRRQVWATGTEWEAMLEALGRTRRADPKKRAL